MNMQRLLQAGLFLHIIVAPAAAHASVAASGYGITSGRAVALLGAAVGLISVVIGALARSGRLGPGRRWAIVALIVGLTGMILSGLHLARATGGFGTGSGRAGAIVGLMIGLTGMVLGGLALARSRRIATGSPRERT